MADPLIQHVSDTAFMIATYRARETERADALFNDPLAGLLAGDHGAAIVRDHPRSAMVQWLVSIRTVIIDDFIQYALSRGIDTIINLGAGLDTRPYRMDLPKALRWIEVDYEWVISFKRDKLKKEKPRCKLKMIRLDLADVTARRKLFSKIGGSSKGVLILTEGVIPYLTVEEAAGLARDLAALPGIRYWIVDYSSPQMHKYRRKGPQGDYMKNAPFKFNPPDWFEFYRQNGWRAADIKYHALEGRRLKRPIPLPKIFMMLISIRALFMSRERREALGKFTGFALLEPR